MLIYFNAAFTFACCLVTVLRLRGADIDWFSFFLHRKLSYQESFDLRPHFDYFRLIISCFDLDR